uniref:Retrotransposon protein, putative, Ty3-gypsy subclass n=1 Tax=Oryza sativa subsp. japonica TaxID=39947 RepID=Q2QQN9_ORYSJ|nr:hypothetical protein LOC_Os12g30380 [Oryza sativa Japonica Group]
MARRRRRTTAGGDRRRGETAAAGAKAAAVAEDDGARAEGGGAHGGEERKEERGFLTEAMAATGVGRDERRPALPTTADGVEHNLGKAMTGLGEGEDDHGH